MNLPALPDPAAVSTEIVVESCRSVYALRDELIGGLPLEEANEARRRSLAIEDYLKGTEAYPDAQRAARTLEMAVGAALGKAWTRLSSPAGEVSKDERYEFRDLFKGRARIEPFLEADGLSREAALRIARGLARAYSSDDDEWYSPAHFVEAAREVMGGIDLDPCSSAVANEVVKATWYYTRETNGLEQRWDGRVWMNPPYERKTCAAFVDKLCEEAADGLVTEACVLLNNITETVFFQRLAEVASAICFPSGRVKFWHPDKVNQPIQGQAIIYIGPNLRTFSERFREFGFTVAVI